jgi:hypothetical protein
VARALSDFLADKAGVLSRADDPLLTGPASPALERYREEKALLAKLDRQDREKSLLPRDQARVSLGRCASILRNAGETLQKQFGPAALEILNEALEDFETEVKRGFDKPQEEQDDDSDKKD